ncbi:TonB-dependent siderophore receptor [Pseudokordiimonas caeni]|uniref:TonB-dependent siderophore receptor n=1 Tax=Pseudokordiimonas caeni TaxID=2997908 RepID=UPI002811AB22|nr:TonB-dependent receptor [Pseudokordiimonas caeni]
MSNNHNSRRMASVFGLSVAASALTVPVFAETYAAGDDVEEIIVSGRAQTLYRVSETSVVRGAADPLDIPQSVTVLNAALIADQGARDMTDLYRNIAGISTFSYSGVTFRGFRQDQVFYDNLRGNPFIAFSVPKLFNIERVEVLKGPAGMLYGPGEPGGLINYVTKVPTEELAASASLTRGNYDRYGAAGDVSGALNKSETILGRVGAFYETMKPFRNNTKDTSLILDGGLTFKLGESARLITQVSHYDQDMQAARLRGVPVDDNGDFLADRSWNTNEASDFLDLKATVLQSRLLGEVSDDWSYELAVRYFDANERQQYHEARGLVDTDADGVVDASRRELRDQERNTEGLTIAASSVINKPLFGLDNTILVGGDYYREDSDFWGRTVPNAEIPLLSLTNPVYGQSGASFYDLESYPLRSTESRLTRTGIYLQDQLSLTDNLILIAGVRYDDFEDEDLLSDTGFSDGDWALRGGVIYKPVDGVSFYASWSESFEPQAISSQSELAGGPFSPMTGSQIEGGVKFDLFNGRLQGGAAVYQIKRQNMLQVDPNGDESDGVADFSTVGEVTSEGFEVELVADLTDAWVLTANYGYNDARITRTVPGGTFTNAVGDRFANAPKHQAGLWTRYEVAAINTTFAAGMEYVGERVSIEGQPVNPYTIFDASIIYTFSEELDVMLRADNIFDKKYAASGFIARTGHFPGEPRTVFVELRWKL